MSNRTLGILILLGFLGVFFSFYLYFFKYNRVNIEILSNLDSYKVELYSTDIKRTFTKECKEKKCIFKDFSPFNYKIRILKKGYRDFNYNLYIRDNGITKINVILKKDIKLKKIKLEDFNNLLYKDINLIKKSKIKKSKIKKSFSLKNLGLFTFKKSGDKLELLNNNISLGLFQDAPVESINIREIYYTNNFFFINIGDKKYIYNLKAKNYSLIKLFTEINYIKMGIDNLHFRLVTNNGTFIYNLVNKQLKYFLLFKDFEIIGDNYIGIIYVNESEKFKNYSYNNKNNENFIMKLNKKTSEKDILLKTKTDMTMILKLDNNRLFFYENENNIYELLNFK